MRMLYRSAPLNPGLGLYRKRIVPISVNVPLVGGAATAAERKLLVAPLRNRVAHALPLVETPVVDTDSFWDRWNVERMMRQSAVAAPAIPTKAISARNPLLSIISPPSKCATQPKRHAVTHCTIYNRPSHSSR
jgi:hypothetical protein